MLDGVAENGGYNGLADVGVGTVDLVGAQGTPKGGTDGGHGWRQPGRKLEELRIENIYKAARGKEEFKELVLLFCTKYMAIKKVTFTL